MYVDWKHFQSRYFFKGGTTDKALQEWAKSDKEWVYNDLIKPHLVKTSNEANENMNKYKESREVAFFFEDLTIKRLINSKKIGECDFIGNAVDNSSPYVTGWMYPYDSMLAPLIDFFLLELHEQGIIDRIKHQKFSSVENCEGNEFTPVNFGFLEAIFILLGIGILLAILLAIIERFANVQIEY